MNPITTLFSTMAGTSFGGRSGGGGDGLMQPSGTQLELSTMQPQPHDFAAYIPADDSVDLSTGSDSEVRKPGVPWTEEEHLMFLIGLQKLGKGDWSGISNDFVKTRNPTQVASHAQKHFAQQSIRNRRRRSSLFDLADAVTPSQDNRNNSVFPHVNSNKLSGFFHVKKKVVSECALMLANLTLEILLLSFDQLASPEKPKYALLALMVALTALVICAFEIIHKGQSKNGKGFMYWLCHPLSNNCPYTYIDAFCTAAAVSQVVFSSIAYSYLHQGRQNPVKVSISAVIFLVCNAFSRLFNRQHSMHLPVTVQVPDYTR